MVTPGTGGRPPARPRYRGAGPDADDGDTWIGASKQGLMELDRWAYCLLSFYGLFFNVTLMRLRPNAFGDLSLYTLMDHNYNSRFFNSEFKFLLIYESNFYVTVFSYELNTREAVGRVSHSRTASNMAATVTSRWILAVNAYS
jgi:hypothetical protein